MDIQAFGELKASGHLPTPAGVGMKILQLTRTDDYEVDEMGQAIMTDSSLTGRVLKLANSAAHAKARPATTVSESIMRLGSSTVRDLCLAFSLVSERRSGACSTFDYEGYWSTSLARAVAAQALANRLGGVRPEEAYICGLLNDVGRLALASVFPDKYATVLGECLDQPTEALLPRERELFDIDHSQVAACMAADWGLPESFSEAIGLSTERRTLTSGDTYDGTLTCLLRLADVLAQVISAEDSASPIAWKRMGAQFDVARQMLEMDEAEWKAFTDACIGEWINWGDSLEVGTHPERRVADILRLIEERGAQAEEMAPVVRSAPQADARTEQAANEASSSEIEEADDRQINILVVDDDPVSLKVLEMQLRREGYGVTATNSGRKALKIALDHFPDIVVADWQMPTMDGMDLCRALRRSDVGRRRYFLLVTGNGEKDVVVDAFDAGVDDFVAKPFLPQVMAARIKGGVRLVQLQQKVENDKRVMMRQVAELGVLTRKLRSISLTDPLTELPNRRYAMKRMESEWSSVLRTGRDLSLVMIDIDHFKSVNDDYGHDVGDTVLKEAARRIKTAIRTSDEVCRIGGEEFLLICKNTAEDECTVVAERIRSAMEAERIPAEGFDRDVTVSLGVAGYEPGMKSFNQLMKLADEALYAAKDNGRNRFVCAADLDSSKKAA